MTNREIVESYIPVARFIARIFGSRCEVLLHDLSDVEHSIIFIENGHITGRSVGGVITDFALRTIFNRTHVDEEFITNYCGKTANGTRTLKSSTLYIRNDSGETIGLLCTNMDITEMLMLKDIIDAETRVTDAQMQRQPSKLAMENFTLSAGELVDSIFEQAQEMTGFGDPGHMLHEEKKEFVAKLYERNLFMLKGAVSETAKRLAISEPTVYRYLREINAGGNTNGNGSHSDQDAF